MPRSARVRPGSVALVGAGPGEPGLITVRGLELLRRADVVVYDRLVHPRLLDEAPRARRVFAGKAAGRHALPQERISALLVTHARRGRRVVRLKGGDPFVFGRGGEEALALARARVPFEIVPGVSAAVAAPAYAGIPLTHRGVACSFAVVTGHEEAGRRPARVDWARLATAVDTLVVLMGVAALPRIARMLVAHGRPAGTPVALVRWGTTDLQETLTGRLDDIAARAARVRLEPPVVAVIGDVVGLRRHLQWFPEHPLPAVMTAARARDEAYTVRTVFVIDPKKTIGGWRALKPCPRLTPQPR
ncbi:MAG: uroporphyrinogen-III C-methyltransferase [Candidatus Rokubacteria bacterium]|nr:uroporphyrinogen-III C-methyltransferase [Candidatus Rokubacteria bacterium]